MTCSVSPFSTLFVLGLAEILYELPVDPASIFTIAIVLVSVALVVWFGRPRGGKGGRSA